MSKCEFFYGTAAVSPGGSYVPMPRDPTLYAHVAVLRCQTHNCEWIMPDGQQCIIGRIEVLEERVAQFERPQSNVGPIDELGNPYSLRIPVKDE